MINWQLSKQGIRCRVSPLRIAGSGVDPSRSSIFDVIRWQVTSFEMIAGSSLFLFNPYEICCVYVPHNSNFDFKLASDATIQPAFFTGRKEQLLLTFLTMVTLWSRITSIFFTLIGQNLTGELMRKIYAPSWNLFTLTAEADRVSCPLVLFLTVFFHWVYKMKFSCYQESSVIMLVCSLGFWLSNTSLVGNPISDIIDAHEGWDSGLTW